MVYVNGTTVPINDFSNVLSPDPWLLLLDFQPPQTIVLLLRVLWRHARGVSPSPVLWPYWGQWHLCCFLRSPWASPTRDGGEGASHGPGVSLHRGFVGKKMHQSAGEHVQPRAVPPPLLPAVQGPLKVNLLTFRCHSSLLKLFLCFNEMLPGAARKQLHFVLVTCGRVGNYECRKKYIYIKQVLFFFPKETLI